MRTGWSLGMVLLLLVQVAQAATYYVATTGAEGGGCSAATTPGTPLRTINAGLRCLGPGDTLLIAGGTYPEVLDAIQGTRWPSGTSWANPVTVAGAPGATVVIEPPAGMAGYVVDMYSSGATEYVILDNLTFRDTQRGETPAVIKTDTGSQYIRISHSRVLGNPGSNGILLGGVGMEIVQTEVANNGNYGIYLVGSRSLVEGNTIHDNGGYGIHQYGSGHSDLDGNILRNNRLVHNGVRSGAPGLPGCAILLSSGTGNVACNNVIEGHGGCGIQVYASARQSLVQDNTIGGTGGACIEVNPGASGTTLAGNQCATSTIQDAGVGTVLDGPGGRGAQAAGPCGGGSLPPIASPVLPLPAPRHFRYVQR